MSDPYRAARLARIRGAVHTLASDAARGTKRGSKRRKNPKQTLGRCVVCGAPCQTYYCHAHSWAEGT